MREQEIQREEIPITQIPPQETTGKMLALTKISSADGGMVKAGEQICGMLKNGPIEPGKPVNLTLGHTSEVRAIVKTSAGYKITTKSGSEYLFDPREAATI